MERVRLWGESMRKRILRKPAINPGIAGA